MRHLKKFKIVDDYFTFKDSTDYLLPNVSYTKKGKKVFFQGVTPPPIIKAKFNATADNLTAITQTSNIKRLKVDGVNIPIPPIVTTSSEIEILAKDVILVGDGSGSIPESTFYNGTPTSWALRPSDSSVNVTNEGYYIGILISINGMTDIIDTYPVNLFLEEGDGTYDELTNTINLNLDAGFGEYLAEMTAMGAKITMMFVNLDENTGTITPIDTVNMCFGQTGGLPGPYVFDTEGYHTIEAEISDKTVISTSMFAGTCITSIELPDSVTSIGNSAFYNCTRLASVVIPDSVTSIGYDAFFKCSGLTSVEIGSGVTSIGDYAFYQCSGLTGELVIPDSVTSIGEWAFSQCSGLTSIEIGSGVTSISDYAFYYCTGLIGELVIPNSVTSIGRTVFRDCSGLTSIEIGSGVTSISDYAFYYCTGLIGELVIPNSVTSIGNNAFSSCSGLTSIVIPDSVTSIGDSAFSGCVGLTGELVIPDSVTSIGDRICHSCPNLESIVVSSGNAVYDSRENCNCIIETSTNSLIQGCKNSFIPDSVTSIGNNAFSSCSGLTSIVIPDSITSIGSQVFSNCSGLTSIVIPDSVTSIGEQVFSYCTSLTSIVIPDSVTSIGYGTFWECTSLISIVIPDSVTSIGDWAFYLCSGLTEITCHAVTAPSIQKNTFYYVKRKGIIYVPSGSDYSSWMSTDSYYLGYYNWTTQTIAS